MKRFIAFLIVTGILAVLFTQDLYLGPRRYGTWMKNGAGKLIPNPDDVLGRETNWVCNQNGSDIFWGEFYVNDASEFEKYADALFESQFRIDFSRNSYLYEGQHINVFRPRTVLAWLHGESFVTIYIVY